MNKCHICGAIISEERLEGLRVLGTNPQFYSCLVHANNNYIKAVWLGESGNSPLVLADSVGQGRIERDNTDYPREI